MTDELEVRRRRIADAFDATFAAPLETARVHTRDYLVVRFTGRAFAVPVDELLSVQKRRRIEAVPDAPRHCLGVTGLRGRPAAVYDLAALVGRASDAGNQAEWLLQSRRSPDVALAAPEAERYLRAERDAVVRMTEGHSELATGALLEPTEAVTVLSLDRVADLIARQLGGDDDRR